MQFHRAPGDGEAESNAAAGSSAVGFDSIERIEDGAERIVGNSGPEVPHGEVGGTIRGRIGRPADPSHRLAPPSGE